MKLNDGDRVVTAWAEHASGPGWSNQIVWVIIRDAQGRLREEGIQPENQTHGMRALFDTAAAVTKSLTAEVLRPEDHPSGVLMG